VAFVAAQGGASTVTLAASVGACEHRRHNALFDANVAALTTAAGCNDRALRFFCCRHSWFGLPGRIPVYFGIQCWAPGYLVDLHWRRSRRSAPPWAFISVIVAECAAYGYSLGSPCCGGAAGSYAGGHAAVPQEALIG